MLPVSGTFASKWHATSVLRVYTELLHVKFYVLLLVLLTVPAVPFLQKSARTAWVCMHHSQGIAL